MRKAMDILNNRVDCNLRWISRAPLVDLPTDRLFNAHEFGIWQAKFLARQTHAIGIRCSPQSSSIVET